MCLVIHISAGTTVCTTFQGLNGVYSISTYLPGVMHFFMLDSIPVIEPELVFLRAPDE